MGVALYRKYRPKSLSEIVGQEHITTTLGNALKTGKISHAYLFTGLRGVGKTSIARILAHEVNDLAYDEQTNHIDIIEIDAASNRGIEEIRELRDKVHTVPTSAKYKVYIIDEVHMLTKQAFNALLKTLEEPPSHVIFILATTEAHKLPETIISRTQRFTFKPVADEKIAEHLQSIAKTEGISITRDALQLIAQHGEGSFRDSIGLLDQASSSGTKLEQTDILKMLGIPPGPAILDLVETMLKGSPSDLIKQLSQLTYQGFRAAAIAKQIGNDLKRRILNNSISFEPSLATKWLHELLDVPAAHDPEAFLEILVLGVNLASHSSYTAKSAPQPRAATDIATEKAPSKPVITATPTDTPIASPTTTTTDTPDLPLGVGSNLKTIKQKLKIDVNPEVNEVPARSPSTASSLIETNDLWRETLETMKMRYYTLYSILRMAEPIMEPGKLTLKFAFAFHQKRINEDANKSIVREIVSTITGNPTSIVCIVEKNTLGPKKTVAALSQTDKDYATNNNLDTISSIFGESEVLES